ncbi:hypothetical protein V8G54_006438 [Vigna mungo]|uniref:Selenoprotein O n=1 Tax=Vigna mungo TaxID=3915 RepID=A0AAQ3P1J1_VIGMU
MAHLDFWMLLIFTPNTTDLPGRRYCFANQPDIGLWNIAQFTTTLQAAHLIDEKANTYAILFIYFLTSEEKIGLKLPLNVSPDCCFFFFRYGTRFMDDYQVIMTKKLGLPKYNKQLINKPINQYGC